MKEDDNELTKRGAQNKLHEQEKIAAGDHQKQREAGAKQALKQAERKKTSDK